MLMRAESHLRLKGLAYTRRMAANDATMAANVDKPARVEINSRVVFGVRAIASWPWLGSA